MNMITHAVPFAPPDLTAVVEWALAYARAGMPVFSAPS